MIYRFMEPPFEMKSFDEMNKREAREHFNWFVSEIPKRMDLLREAYQVTTGNDKERLDFNPESLKVIWEWFIPYVSLVPKTEEEIQKDIDSSPAQLAEVIQEEDRYKLSTETVLLGVDVGIYFGEVFARNFDQLEWGFVTRPKSIVDVNRPVITGFANKVHMNPIETIHNLSYRVSEGEIDKDRLYDIFENWLEDLD